MSRPPDVAADRDAPPAPTTRLLLSTCFFLSGGAGLVYEVLWSRHLHLLFGSTTESVATVLSMFMAGLGLGGHLLGRAADRSRSPMRLYGLLEIGVGLYALATPLVLRLVQALYAASAAHLHQGAAGGRFSSLALLLVKLVLAALVLVPPATLMGGTLPALVRATAARADVARAQVGLLYALNTLGAVLGTLLSGFVLVEVLGLSTSMQLTGVLNLGIGALVWARAERHRRALAAIGEDARVALADEPPDASPPSLLARYAAVGLFVSGATVMMSEVVYTRVLGLVFGVSSYAFSLVLAVFLAGLGGGALVAHRMTRGRAPRAIDFGLSQILLAGVAGLTMAAVPSVPRLLLEARQLPDLGFGEVLGLKAGLAAIILLPLSIVAGVGTPLLLAALAHSTERPGRVIGRAYMINTAGTLLGSLAAGFFLVERLGTQGTLRAAAILSLGIGLAGVLPSVFGARLALRIGSVVASLLVAALVIGEARWPVMTFLLSDTRGQHSVATNRLAIESQLRLAPTELLYFAEGRDATVGVTAWGNRTLYVNGHPDASDHLDMATQLMLSVVPLVAEPSPEDVLVVGFGSGVSASAATRVPEVKHVDVVELEEAVLAASPSFHHVNHAVESDPRVRLIRDDARSVLVAPPRLYDAIISEPSNPWRAGVASLFTMEFYRSARAALKPGGVFAQWVQLYGLDERTLRMVLQTLSSSFPELQIWWLDPGNIVVLGSSVPLPIDPARVTRLVGGEFRADLARYAWIGADDEFYGRFLVGTGDVRAWLDDGSQQVTENTDDLPLLEFEAPRGLFLGDGQNALRLVALKLLRGAMLPPLVRGRPSAAAVWSSIATIYRTAHRLPEARIAMDHAMGAERSARLLAGAAELALEAGDLRAAEALLADAAALPADPRSPQGAIDAQRVIEMTALLRAKQRRLADAVAILDTASDLDGRLGVPRLRALVALRRGDDALKQAERLLSHARLGGEIDAMEVEQIYLALGDLGASHAATVAALTSLIDRFPLPGLPSFPREKALAGLCRMGADPTQALAHAHQALVGGALDLKLFEIEIWALGQLGRYGEADELRALRRTLNPASAVEPVASPLLEKSQERALERAPDPPRPSDGDAEVATPPAAHP